MTAVSREGEPAAFAQHRAIDIGTLLDEGRWGGYQKLVVALVALTIVFDGVDIQLLGIALPSIMADWGVGRSAFSLVLAGGLVGMMLGAICGGMIGDRFGRRRALIGSVLIFGMLTAATAFADSIASLGILRFLAGVGLGGALPNATALTSEYVPRRFRPVSVTLTIVCVPLGGVLAGLVGAEILSRTSWHMLFAVGGLAPMVVAALLLWLLPESPKHLTRHPHRWPQLRGILRRMGHELDSAAAFVDASERSSGRASVGTLFSPSLRRDTLALWVTFFSCLIAVYIGFNWLPTLLTANGLSIGAASRGLAAFNVGGVLAALLGAALIAPFGSKRIMLSMAAIALAGAMILMVMPIRAEAVVPVVLALGVMGGAINGVQTLLYALAAHVYPTAVRATGVGSASAVGRFGAIASVFVGTWALAASHRAFFIVIGVAMTSTFIALACLREHVPSSKQPSPGVSS